MRNYAPRNEGAFDLHTLTTYPLSTHSLRKGSAGHSIMVDGIIPCPTSYMITQNFWSPYQIVRVGTRAGYKPNLTWSLFTVSICQVRTISFVFLTVFHIVTSPCLLRAQSCKTAVCGCFRPSWLRYFVIYPRFLQANAETKCGVGWPRHRWDHKLKWIFKKQNVEVRPLFIWLGIWASGGLFWTRQWTFGLHKTPRITFLKLFNLRFMYSI